MARKKSPVNCSLTRGEIVSGMIFFFVYYLVMPFLLTPAIHWIGRLLGISVDGALGNLLYYFLLFAVTLAVFWHYLGANLSAFFNNLNRSCSTLFMALVAFYGLNELLYRLTHSLTASQVNLNDIAITAQFGAAPHMTAVMVILLAPFVEEVLFRGLIFGALREKSRVVAYVVSAVLFAFGHVLHQLSGGLDLASLTLIFQYLAPGLVFAWAYERSGNVWTPILLHAAVNALALFVILI